MGKKLKDEDEDEVFDIQEFKKEHKQKENNMKNIKNNSTVKTALTIIGTLIFVAYSAGLVIVGMNIQSRQDETIKLEAVNLSKAMASKTELNQ